MSKIQVQELYPEKSPYRNRWWASFCLQGSDGRYFQTFLTHAPFVLNCWRHDVQQIKRFPLAHHWWGFVPIDPWFTSWNSLTRLIQPIRNLHQRRCPITRQIRNGQRCSSHPRARYPRSRCQLGQSTKEQKRSLHVRPWVHGTVGCYVGLDLQIS